MKKRKQKEVIKKTTAKCENCIFLYSRHGGKGPCWGSKTTKPTKRACRSYKRGRPFIPTINKKVAKVITLEEKAQAFVFYMNDYQALVASWGKDLTEQWHWSFRLVGLRPTGGIHKKRFSSNSSEVAAFHGEIEILGPGLTALFSSFGFEDVDDLDEDGNIVNKPREIRVYPVQQRKRLRGHDRKK